MIQFPLPVVLLAFGRLGSVFFDKSKDPHAQISEIVGYAQKARKEGIVSLDSEVEKISDPFLKKSLMLAVDGTEPQELQKMMELELDNQAEHEEHIPKVFESAGGFAPTVGIIGAVLGLIQVMQHLDNINEVGPRHRGGLRGHHLRGGRGQPVLSALLGKDQDAHPPGTDRARNDARRA